MDVHEAIDRGWYTAVGAWQDGHSIPIPSCYAIHRYMISSPVSFLYDYRGSLVLLTPEVRVAAGPGAFCEFEFRHLKEAVAEGGHSHRRLPCKRQPSREEPGKTATPSYSRPCLCYTLRYTISSPRSAFHFAFMNTCTGSRLSPLSAPRWLRMHTAVRPSRRLHTCKRMASV